MSYVPPGYHTTNRVDLFDRPAIFFDLSGNYAAQDCLIQFKQRRGW